jgi:adenine-specific DNA-methyltransferase
MKLYSDHRIGPATAVVWHGDALEVLESLPASSVDLIVTSPPYFVGKEYDTSQSAADFTKEIRRVLPSMMRCLKVGGSLCWQVGNHVRAGNIIPLDALIVAELIGKNDLLLRNRIVWTFGHGAHASKRFSGRHETILWYTMGSDYYFDLDSVRVPQLYPGKRHYKGPKKGEWSGNPLGKNPGDVWEIGDIWKIPNVKANHVEKTAHPCQFPTALVRRLVLALAPPGGVVLDPYLGSGTAAIAALLEKRNFIGSDIAKKYLRIAKERILLLEAGTLNIREDAPVSPPTGSVATLPAHFKLMRDEANG